jgi:hypothetical protein
VSESQSYPVMTLGYVHVGIIFNEITFSIILSAINDNYLKRKIEN